MGRNRIELPCDHELYYINRKRLDQKIKYYERKLINTEDDDFKNIVRAHLIAIKNQIVKLNLSFNVTEGD